MVSDGNPTKEGIHDAHRLVYLPATDEHNMMVELPNANNAFFTTQKLAVGAEVFVLEDVTLHKSWVIVINNKINAEMKRVRFN